MSSGVSFCRLWYFLVVFLICFLPTDGQIQDCHRCIDRGVTDYLTDLGKLFALSHQNSWPECYDIPKEFTVYKGKCVLLEFSGKNNTTAIFQADLTAIEKLPYGLESKLETMFNNLNSYVIIMRGIRVKLYFCKRACPILAKRFAAAKPVSTTSQPIGTSAVVSKKSSNQLAYILLCGFIILLMLTSFTIHWKRNQQIVREVTFYKGSQPVDCEEPVSPSSGQADYLVFA